MTLAGTHDPLGEPDSEIQAPQGSQHMDLGVGESMFETMGKPPSFAPSAEEMAKAYEDVQRTRKVELKEVVSRTYNLSDDAAKLQYTTDLEHIMMGTAMRTHMLIDKPPKEFVSDGGESQFIAYLEWAEFRLIEEPIQPVGV